MEQRGLTRGRVQEECQPRDDAGYDEDGYAAFAQCYVKANCVVGHVEKTNDRDYEVEERSATPEPLGGHA